MPVNRYVYIDYLSKVWIKFITMAFFKFFKPGTQTQDTHIFMRESLYPRKPVCLLSYNDYSVDKRLRNIYIIYLKVL